MPNSITKRNDRGIENLRKDQREISMLQLYAEIARCNYLSLTRLIRAYFVPGCDRKKIKKLMTEHSFVSNSLF